MNIRECFEKMGENIDDVLSRLRKEERVAKYSLLFLKDPSFDELCAAYDKGDVQTAFRAAHTLKGAAANIGFNQLSHSASELTEALRNGQIPANGAALLSQVKLDYTRVTSNIRAFQASQNA